MSKSAYESCMTEMNEMQKKITRLTAELVKAQDSCVSWRTEFGIERSSNALLTEQLAAARAELKQIKNNVRLHLTYHEHGCAYLGHADDYEE